MTEEALCALIETESASGIGAEDRLSRDRATAMSFYMGEAKGDLAPPDTDGRSRVVSKDVQEVVEWVHPTLMRTFAGSEQVIKFEPTCQGDEDAVKQASEYCSYTFWRKNPGYFILSDAIKSALITRHSFVKVYWDKTHVDEDESYQGLSEAELEALRQDPEIEITEVEEVSALDTVSGQPALPPDALGGGHPIAAQAPSQLRVFNIKAKRTADQSKVTVEGVPSERMRMSKETRLIEDLRYIEHREEKTVSDLISLGYDKDKVQQLQDDLDESYEAIERGDYDDSWDTTPAPEDSQRVVWLQDVYMRVDFDGDGIAEYRHIVKSGAHVFENEVCDGHPFAQFDCLLMPHKLVGIGIYDLLEDLQRIKTAITRQVLDNLYMANNPRKLVNSNSGTDLDALIHAQPNGIVLTDNIDNAVTELVTPFVGQAGLSMLDYYSTVRDGRSGVSSFNQGLTGGELSKSALGSEGVESLLNQGQQRIELIARNLAEGGLKRVWGLILKNLTQHMDRHDQIMVDGEWLPINPRAWATKYDMTTSVGIGTASKKEQIQNLMLIGNAVQQAGTAIPGLVAPENVYNLLAKLIKASGEHNPDQYITNPKDAPPPQAQPDPAMAKVQAESQARMAELQQQGQLEQAKQQGTVEVERMKQEFQAQQAQQETQLEAQRNQLQAANDKEMAQFKAQLEYNLAIAKAEMAQQTAITVARINAEAKILSAKTMGAKDGSTADADANYQEAHENG